jgi:predicted ATPase
MEHKLREFTIAGYKSIRDQNVELRNINILIGANGAGKSNFVSAFRFLHDIVAGQLAVRVAQQGGANKLLHFGIRTTSEMPFKLNFDPNGYELALAAAVNDSLYFSAEKYWFRGQGYNQPLVTDLGAAHVESKLSEPKPRNNIAPHVIDSVRSWRVFHFHDTSDSAPAKLKQQLNDNQALQSNAKNLAAFLYRLREQRYMSSKPGFSRTSDRKSNGSTRVATLPRFRLRELLWPPPKTSTRTTPPHPAAALRAPCQNTRRRFTDRWSLDK